MAHFAKVVDNKVTEIIVAEQDFISTLEGRWIQTSYNTIGGIHYGLDGKPDGGKALRKNYASIGCLYDETLDAFMQPRPFKSWILNPETCQWTAPTPMPVQVQPSNLKDIKYYFWDESKLDWAERTNLEPKPIILESLENPNV